MTKTTIKETIEKYDNNGQIIEKITREEITEDENITVYPETPNTPYAPLYPYYSYTNIGDFKTN